MEQQRENQTNAQLHRISFEDELPVGNVDFFLNSLQSTHELQYYALNRKLSNERHFLLPSSENGERTE